MASAGAFALWYLWQGFDLPRSLVVDLQKQTRFTRGLACLNDNLSSRCAIVGRPGGKKQEVLEIPTFWGRYRYLHVVVVVTLHAAAQFAMHNCAGSDPDVSQ